jgi:hypothetical protein
MQDYLAFIKSYIPDRDPSDLLTSSGYGLAQASSGLPLHARIT